MVISKKYKSPLAIIIYICSLTAAIASGVQGFIYLKGLAVERIDAHAIELVEDYLKNRSGGVRSGFAKQTGVEKDEVIDVMADMYFIVFDSLDVMRKEFIPMLMEMRKWQKIGLERNALTGKLKYIHTDGEEYRPFKDNKTKLYKFINEDEEYEWCK